MHSKWQIWDFFPSFQKNYLESFNGVLALSTFDPICLKMAKDFLLRGVGERIVHHKIASEVNRQWIEEEFQTLSLFGGADCFFIHQAQDLKADTQEAFSALDLTDRFVILVFDTENANWKKLLKENKIGTLIIEPPRFWENNKLLDFTSAYLRLPLSYEAKAWIMDSLENDLSTFYNTCTLLKLNFPAANEVSLSDVKSLFTVDRLDQFALASLFARRKFVDFYEKLVLLEGDFDKMRAFFNFMQGHLVKMADPSYLSGKPRLSQYDKDLQSTARLWGKEELVESIQRFSDWEIQSKRKDHLLWTDIRSLYLRTLSRR